MTTTFPPISMAADLRGFQIRVYKADRDLIEQTAIARNERITAFIIGSALDRAFAVDFSIEDGVCEMPQHRWRFRGQYQEVILMMSRKYSKAYLTNLAIDRLLSSPFPLPSDTVKFKEVRFPGRARPLPRMRFGTSRKTRTLRTGVVVAQSIYMKPLESDYRFIANVARSLHKDNSTYCRESALNYCYGNPNKILTRQDWIDRLLGIAKEYNITFDELIQCAMNRLAVDIASGVQIFPHHQAKEKQEVC